MSRERHVAAACVLVLLVAASCSKPKEHAAQVGGTTRGASALAAAVADRARPGGPVAGKLGPRAVEVSGPASKGYAALNPAADSAQAARVGSLIKLRSTSYADPATWTGVTKDTIRLDFGIDKTNCGANLLQILSNAGAAFAKGDRFYRPSPTDQGAINKEQEEAIKLTVQYWNDHVTEVAADSPEAVAVMKRYNTPGHSFYGRKLTYDLVDVGSFQCPEKQVAGAITMRDSTKPFSSVVYDVPGLYQNGYGLASAMKAKIPADARPMIFGLIDTSDKYLSSFAPYAWDEFQSITKMSKLGAEWICSDLRGTGPNAKLWGGGKAVNASDPALRTKPRKFGLIYPNDPNATQAADDIKRFLAADCGMTFDKSSTEFAINSNPARAADEGNQIAVRFKVAGVTTVIYLIDFLGAFFHIIDYKNQGYGPEFAEIGTGWQTSTVQRLSPDQDMLDKASMGYSSFGIQGFGYGPGDPFWVYHSYHRIAPDGKPCDPRSDLGMTRGDPASAVAHYCRAPGAIAGWYYSWLPLVGGLLFAGPNLTPGTVSAGLQAYPQTRYGVDGPTVDPVAVLVGAGPDQYYFITDGSTFRWRANYVSPPPENLLGWPEFPDCQRHYVSWPDGLAPQWERSGPNYNAWCGSSRYASFKYEPRADSGDTCADSTTHGVCEKDDYPRWEPVLYR